MAAIESVEEFFEKIKPGQTFFVVDIYRSVSWEVMECTYSDVDGTNGSPKLEIHAKHPLGADIDASPYVPHYVEDLIRRPRGTYTSRDEAETHKQANSRDRMNFSGGLGVHQMTRRGR